MFFCHYGILNERDEWVDLLCWGETPDDAYRGVKEQCEFYNRDPLPEHMNFGKRINIEVETRTVLFVVEAE